MERKRTNTEKLVITAILIALEVILTRFVGISTPMLRISFGFLPMVVVAMYYGPIWGGGAYALADVLGSLIFPTGAYFPGFTVSACLTGIICGLFLHKRKVTVGTSLAAVIAVVLGINLLVNTFWLTIILGKGYMAMLPARFVKELLCVPIDTALILVLSKATRRIYRPAA